MPSVLKTKVDYPGLDTVLAEMERLAVEYADVPRVKGVAKTIRNRAGRTPASKARAVDQWVRSHIEYRRDPSGVELLQSPDVTLRRGAADCDGHSVLVAALLMRLGVPVRYRAIAQRERGEYDHVYPVWKNEAGEWRFMDTTEQVPVGPDPYLDTALSVKNTPVMAFTAEDDRNAVSLSSSMGRMPSSKREAVALSRRAEKDQAAVELARALGEDTSSGDDVPAWAEVLVEDAPTAAAKIIKALKSGDAADRAETPKWMKQWMMQNQQQPQQSATASLLPSAKTLLWTGALSGAGLLLYQNMGGE